MYKLGSPHTFDRIRQILMDMGQCIRMSSNIMHYKPIFLLFYLPFTCSPCYCKQNESDVASNGYIYVHPYISLYISYIIIFYFYYHVLSNIRQTIRGQCISMQLDALTMQTRADGCIVILRRGEYE